MTAAGCADVRLSLGVYVLGALEPADRGRVDIHLATCAACRDELAGMAALPGLLSRVSISEVDDVRPPGPQLLDRVVAAAVAERQRGRRVRWLVAVAAGVVIAAGTAVGVSVSGGHQAKSPTVAATAKFAATDPTTRVSAQVTEWAKGWGAALEVKVDGTSLGAYGGRCQLVVVSSDGEHDVAASWTAPASGRVDVTGATALATSQITAFRVVGSNGATLVSIPVAASGTPTT